MKLAEVLEGKRAGKIQKCGVMSIIPIFYQDEDLICHNIGSPKQSLRVERNHNYGEMCFKNRSKEKPTIIPNNFAVIDTKQAAQDHAMSKTGFMKPNESASYGDAFCIQESQGGMLQGKDDYDFIVLPYALRHKAFAKKGSSGYSRLWDDIKSFNKEMGVTQRHAHLCYFFEKYNDKLGDFIAQFECHKDQTGAIILIDNKIVGVEIAPNPEYWLDVWKPLIRDCYGSEVIRRLINGAVKVKPLEDTKISKAASLECLERAVVDFEDELKAKTEAILASIANQNLNETRDSETSHRVIEGGVAKKYYILDVKNASYVGQIVKENEFVCYASITANAGRIAAKRSFAF